MTTKEREVVQSIFETKDYDVLSNQYQYSLVKYLTHQHNGDIKLNYLDASKTIISLHFNLPLQNTIKQQEQKQQISAHTLKDKQTKETCNVLIVEDNKINQKISEHYLQEFGCYAAIVPNGKEAIEQLKQHDFDIILMDIEMPIMDGFATTTKIRKDSNIGKQEIPIIALTAYEREVRKQDCLKLGMNDFLQKPFKKQQLQAIIQKWTGFSGKKTI